MENHEKIREKFKWGRNFDKNDNRLEETQFLLLKDISNSHLISICIYFTNRLNNISVIYEKNNMDFLPIEIKNWTKKHLIFLNELKYRYNNSIIVEDYN